MLGCYIPRASWVQKQGGMEAGCPDAGLFPFASCRAVVPRPGSKVLSPRPKQREDVRTGPSGRAKPVHLRWRTCAPASTRAHACCLEMLASLVFALGARSPGRRTEQGVLSVPVCSSRNRRLPLQRAPWG